MTAEQRRLQWNRGREWFRSLPTHERWELGDALVLGTFCWADWLDTKPPPGFLGGVDYERILWEASGAR